MNRLLGLVLAGTLGANLAFAENFTEANAAKAQAVIEAAIEAHGGDALNGLHTVITKSETLTYSVNQSRGTEPPWDTTDGTALTAIDLENSTFALRATASSSGFESNNGTIINGEDSYQLDFRSGTVAKIAAPDFATTSGPIIRITPALLVRTLNDRSSNAHYLGETEIDGQSFNVIAFSMTVGPAISLYFDKQTNRLHRSERIFPGFGLVEYEFEDYTVVDGILFNQVFNLYLNGEQNMVRKIKSIEVNASLDDMLQVDENLVAIPAVEPDPLSREEIADGVWLIGANNTYAMFVDMGDYIFAAGGTGGSPDRIASLREVVGEKPIRYALMTHHHSDHVLAIPSYEEAGATIIAATAHERIVRNAAGDGENLSFKAVDERMTLTAGDRRLEIIDIGPTAHTEHLLIAYLPGEDLIFEADHFAVPVNGPIPPAVQSTRTFAAALARQELDIKTIVSAHSSKPGTWEDLQTALNTDVFQASR